MCAAPAAICCRTGGAPRFWTRFCRTGRRSSTAGSWTTSLSRRPGSMRGWPTRAQQVGGVEGRGGWRSVCDGCTASTSSCQGWRAVSRRARGACKAGPGSGALCGCSCKCGTWWVSTAPCRAAVWSMVGHTVGLGDRHGENILVGSASCPPDARLAVRLPHRSLACLEQQARLDASCVACLPPSSCSQAPGPGRPAQQPYGGPACHGRAPSGTEDLPLVALPWPCPQIDCSNGDVVHVDFSCLFDKGLTLAKPEMVPFRCARASVQPALGRQGAQSPAGASRCC